jgi:FkbM family methyltransferase
MALCLVSLAIGLAMSERTRLEIEFFYKSRVAQELSAAHLQVEAAPGLRMFVQPGDAVISPVLIGWGEWEPMETLWFSRLLGDGDTFVDVGANIGYFTIVGSRLVGPEGHVIAFEPDPIAYALLEKNVRLNQLENVELVQKAASNEAGTLQLYLASENKGDHRIYQTDKGRFAINVEAIPLDDFFAERGREIDLMKIDTQGAEGVILDGMQNILAENTDMMMAIEFWPAGLAKMGYEAAKIVETLREHDFVFFDLGPGPELLPELRRIADPDLLEGLTIENDLFTNVLMIKGLEEMRGLTQQVSAIRDRLFSNTPELAKARMAWEAEVRTQRTAPKLPVRVITALAIARQVRTKQHEQDLQNYFRATSPLLADVREDLKQAGKQLEVFQEQLISSKRRDQ